ncbi:YqzE family protein [Paenibacillus glacialis]|uniref:YqzE family protein n=1 Tax=Paenibacillus glacialis TaxID=494026 RepID=A0A168BWH0_9BACL|nr:YqzE family protein [Paenibacillus glacialis]OAB32835.1 hypothetical protein PGLA_25395 [Paenibacillus glacialis]
MGDELKLVKYITEQVVTYIETPRQERHTGFKEPWSTKWFGMIPISLSLWRSNTRTSREVQWEDPNLKEHVN